MQSVRKSFLTCGLLFLFSALLCAQEIRVETFRQLDRDLLARTHERLDLNDVPCAVVRVAVRQPESFEFEGNVVGDPVYETGEALVWMASGSRNITLKSNDYGVLRYEFPQRLERSAVYELVVSIEQPVATEQGLLMDYTPASAKVYIDDRLQSEASDGLLSTVLSVGSHSYRVECPGYITERGTLYIVPERPATVNVELATGRTGTDATAGNAYLTVRSNKRRTELYLNGKYLGHAPFRSEALPSGTYNLSARRRKCFPQSREVMLPANEMTEVKFSMEREWKWTTFLMFQYDKEVACDHAYPTDAFGLMFGMCRKSGFYVATGFDIFAGKDSGKSYWNVKTGVMGRAARFLYYYVGTGLLHNKYRYYYSVDYDYGYDLYNRNVPLLDLGLIARYRTLSFSVGYIQSIPFDVYKGLTFSIGIALGNWNK